MKSIVLIQKDIRMPRDNGKKKDDMDAILMEYNLALDEHKIVNAQILHFQEANTKLYEFGLIALGAIVVAASFVIEQKAYNLLLVLNLPFHVLMWLQTRRGIVSNHLANYIIFEVHPEYVTLLIGIMIMVKNQLLYFGRNIWLEFQEKTES